MVVTSVELTPQKLWKFYQQATRDKPPVMKVWTLLSEASMKVGDEQDRNAIQSKKKPLQNEKKQL